MLHSAYAVPIQVYLGLIQHSFFLAYSGNQGSLHHLDKCSTHLPSLSYQQQRYSKTMLYPAHKGQKCKNPQMGKVSKVVDQMVIYVSAVDNWNI